MKRLLDYDPVTGVRETFVSREDGGFDIITEQDCEPIIEENKRKQSAGRAYYARDPDGWRVAEIPIVVQMKWMTEHGVDVLNRDHWPAVRRLLNDPEWRYLKTAEVII